MRRLLNEASKQASESSGQNVVDGKSLAYDAKLRCVWGGVFMCLKWKKIRKYILSSSSSASEKEQQWHDDGRRNP